MEGNDVLLTTAELALALGGFGGVVAAFRGRSVGWNPIEVVRFRALIIISLTSALFALLPFPLFHAGFEPATMWATASLLVAAATLIALVVMLIYSRRAMVAYGSKLWSGIAALTTVISLLIHTLNASGIGFTRSFTGYFVGLLLLLFMAGLYFIRIIIMSGPASETSE